MKHLIIAVIGLVVTFSNLQAQSGCFSRIDSIVSMTFFPESKAIAADSKGNYYITGGGMGHMYYNGNVFIGEGLIYLSKFNKNHQIVWNKKGGAKYDGGFGEAIAVDDQDNIIFGGYYERFLIFGKDTLSAQYGGRNNPFITKFRPDGTHLWSKRIHTPGLVSSGKVISLSTDGFGNIYFGGSFAGSLIFGQDTIQDQGLGDNFWGKMDAMGNIQWIKAAGSKLLETGVNVAAASIGNLYVIGDVNNSQDLTYVDDSLNYNGVGFIAKYSPFGKMKWLKGAEKGEFWMGVRTTGGKIQTKNGFVIIAASMYSDSNIVSIAGAQTTIDSNARGPAFVLKLDTAGNGIWLKEAIRRYLTNINVMGVAIKRNGDIALTTHTGNYIEKDTLPIVTDRTPVYLTLNGNNGQIMNYCYPKQPGNGSYLSNGITMIGDTIFATGSFDLKTNGRRRIFIATIPPNSVGIEEQYLDNQNISIYPNPSKNGKFTMDLTNVDGIEIKQLNVFNLNGQMVYAQKVKTPKNQKMSFQLNGLTKGIYIISLQHSKGVMTKKLVVQ